MSTLLLALLVPYVQAAEAGSVRGRVDDQDGLGIPGATVVISGPGIAGELQATTDEDGNFRFGSVPVGSHELEVLKTGFPKAKRKVRVRLGEDAYVGVSLTVGMEEVVIEETLPVLDTTRSSVSTSLSAEQMSKMPVGRSYQDVVNILPGVSGRVDTSSGGPGDGNPSVRGEGQYGNNYTLDGISTRDPATKTFGSNVNFDAIQEIQTYTDGAPAEFGQATGMLVNVITKDGGDEHHGSAGYFLTTAASGGTYLILDPTLHEEVETAKREFMVHSLALTAGGPIVKEKLWYFASVELDTDTTTYEGQSPDAPYQSYGAGGFGKLTWFATPDVRIRYQVNFGLQDIENDITSSLVLPEAQERYHSDDLSNQVQFVWRPEAKTEMDLKVIHALSHINVAPMSGDADTAQVTDLETGYVGGNASSFDDNTRSRTGFTMSVTQLVDKAWGNHKIKVGLDGWLNYEARELRFTGPGDGLIATSTADYPCSAPDYADCFTRQEFEYVGALPHKSVVLSAYLQDDWQPTDFLSINAGMRVDHEELYTSEDVRILEQWMPAPRLGVAWDATRDEKTKVTLNAGRYYDVNGSSFAEWGDTRSSAGYSYYYGPYSQTEPYFSQGAYPLVFCTEASLDQLDEAGRAAAEEACNGDLRPYHLDKIVVGFEREVIPLLALGVRGILSRTSDIPEDINYDDINWVITNPENKYRDYWALEFTAEKELDKHWQLLASYTLSESKGTLPGQFELASNSEFGGNGNEVGTWGDDIGNPDVRAAYFDGGGGSYLQGYAGLGSYSNEAGYYGYLPYHSLHSVKVNGSYTFETGKFEHTVGLIYEMDSGHAWQKRGYVANYQDYLAFPEGRGTRFMPVTHYVDLHIGEVFSMEKGRSIELTVDVFNLLDFSEAITYYENDDENFGLTMYRQAPRSIQAGLKVNY